MIAGICRDIWYAVISPPTCGFAQGRSGKMIKDLPRVRYSCFCSALNACRMAKIVLLLGAVTCHVSISPTSWSAAQTTSDIVESISSYTTGSDDNLLDLAREHELGFIEIVAANPGVDPWNPGVGRKIILPTAHILPDAPREGFVINLAELRLYWFPKGGKAVQTFPLGAGRLGLTTPVGKTRIVRKRPNPIWVPTSEARADNPDLPSSVPPPPARTILSENMPWILVGRPMRTWDKQA